MYFHKTVVGLGLAINLAVMSISGTASVENVVIPEEPPEQIREVSQDTLISFKSAEYGVSEVLVREIIRRESEGRPEVCNHQFGCIAGQGLMQLIPSTVKYCELKLNKEIDPFKAEDNLDCGLWLLSQPNGIMNWQPYSGNYSAFMGE